ncbi:hypothetical protein, partial [Erythrobacter sp. YJ-T3-07]|uniref:hypothetical protein n=1 Tax=Erythrobacter sp. YJ-T3-07 TaxID=2793063 RepID=UPI001F40E742
SFDPPLLPVGWCASIGDLYWLPNGKLKFKTISSIICDFDTVDLVLIGPQTVYLMHSDAV